MKLKYKLPDVAKLIYKFDIDKLKNELEKLESKFISVMPANGELCSNSHQLVKNVYDHFDQINLTTYKDLKNVTLEECEQLYFNNPVKNRIRRDNIDPGLDEHNYNVPTKDYVGTYFEEIANTFKCKAIRVRLTKLNPKKTLIPHIDYDPSYATRIIIPIKTNPLCINQFWRKNVLHEYHLKADGSAYFLNTGIKHSVINNGDESRIALMFSLDGITDIENLIQE